MTLPPNAVAHIHMDSASVINHVSQIIHHPFKFSKYLLNLPNHTLWAKIYDHIHHKNLTIIVTKVLAHSNDPLNDHADALAKEATNNLNSDITTFDPTPFSTLIQTTISYDSIPTIDTKLCPLLRDCFDASYLTQLLSLKRFSKYLVDWEFTMLLFKHKLSHGTSSSHQHTTSTVQAFRLKLFYDELLTMQNLAVR